MFEPCCCTFLGGFSIGKLPMCANLFEQNTGSNVQGGRMPSVGWQWGNVILDAMLVGMKFVHHARTTSLDKSRGMQQVLC